MAVGMERRADTLRLIAGRLGLEELAAITRQPGINEAYRITLHYHDGRHPDQVATLTRARHEAVLLSVKYKRFHHQPAFEYPFAPDVYHDFDLAMRRLGFGDQYTEMRLRVPGRMENEAEIRVVVEEVEDQIERSGRPILRSTITPEGPQEAIIDTVILMLSIFGLIILLLSGLLLWQ